jgi:hypothetical protein
LNEKSLKLFRLIEEDTELTQAYFCFLVFSYTQILNDKNSTKILEKEAESSNQLKFLVDHFENAIEMSNSVKFVKVLQKNAAANPAWEWIIEMLRRKRGLSTQTINENVTCIE